MSAVQRDLPHLTVAVVVRRGDDYLLVEERDKAGDGTQMVYNQPAGHVENDESVTEAAVRETLEETGWRVSLESVVGIYHYTAPNNGVRYVRLCFAAKAVEHLEAELDPDIEAVHWLGLDALRRRPLRSPLVLQVIEDYESGQRFPLSLIK